MRRLKRVVFYFYKKEKKRKDRNYELFEFKLEKSKILKQTLKNCIEEIKINVTKMVLSYLLIFSKRVNAIYVELNFGISPTSKLRDLS